MLFFTSAKAGFHQTSGAWSRAELDVALPPAPSGSAVLCWAGSGLAPLVGGTDGLTCDLVGGPERRACGDTGS